MSFGGRTLRRTALLGAIALAALVAVLFLPTIQLRSAPAPGVSIGNVQYTYESETVFGPQFSNFSYRGVLFEFEVYCQASPGGGAEICGSVTGPSASPYAFQFEEPGGAAPINPLPWQTWISPDHHEGVQFEPDSGGQVRLLVAN
ncbi:MAG: hypothetical protein L3K11_01845 [Thermoplasmata archaeon]|nr:hypothetical protein [Thermoplasmata archaeon]